MSLTESLVQRIELLDLWISHATHLPIVPAESEAKCGVNESSGIVVEGTGYYQGVSTMLS